MYQPVLVAPPSIQPLTRAEVKAHLRVDDTDNDPVIDALITAATVHLDGWTGVLGCCLVEQTWLQNFDCFERCLRLPLFPVISITSLIYRDDQGQLNTVAAANYALQADGLGAYVRFKDEYDFPGGLYQRSAVSVTYVAGYANSGAAPNLASGIPAAIKHGMLLLIGHWYENREAIVIGDRAAALPFAVDALLSPYRRVRI